MSSTEMMVNNPLAVKLFAKKDWVQTVQQTCFGKSVSRGGVYFPEEFRGQNARGDNITYAYVGKLTGLPLGEGGTLDGNEEALDLGNYQMAINLTRHGVLNPNEDTIEQQRTFVDFESNARMALKRRFAEYLDTAFFYQLAGADPNTLTINGTTYSTAAHKLHVQGHNTPVAPSANRVVRAGGAATDQALGSTDKMTLDMIDYALELNERSDQPIEPLSDGTYDLYVSPEQATQLKQDATGAIQWFNIALAHEEAGKKSALSMAGQNGLRAVGVYGNVNIHIAPRIAYGVNASTGAVITTVRRAVLIGNNAVTFASPFGGIKPGDKQVPFKYKVQLKDYEYYKGVEGRLIWGMKKTTPSNGEDIGVIVLSTYAAANTGA